jgi:hypothetical protein
LFQLVKLGLKGNDYDNMRQYLVLLENLLTARTCEWHAQFFDHFITGFLEESIGENLHYYMWMEVILEWIFKIAGNHNYIAKWFSDNCDKWAVLV